MNQNKYRHELARGARRWHAARLEGKVKNIGIKNKKHNYVRTIKPLRKQTF